MNENIRTLVELNSRVVSFMMDGDRANVYSILRPTLVRLRRLLAEVNRAQAEGLQDMATNEDQHESIHFLPIEETADPRSSDNKMDQDSFVLFNQVVGISPELNGNQALSTESQFRLAVCVMYNVALFLHQEGIRTGMSAKTIVKARQYYKVALEMLRGMLGNRSEDMVLELAFLNNLGHLEEGMHANGKGASEYLEELVLMLNHRQGFVEQKFADFFGVVTYTASPQGILTLSPAA